ncbi:MAG: hypothetical protein HYU86_07660 [Chloroflexi bacterium]|nr:hypothetical protein [Chloroflexota bacterium]
MPSGEYDNLASSTVFLFKPDNILLKPVLQSDLAITISDEAKSMIKQEGLEAAIAMIKESITELWREGASIKEVVVEREVDPEIEALEVLAVTVWMQNVSSKEASSFWKALDDRMDVYRAALPPEEREKLDKGVSVGVDIE